MNMKLSKKDHSLDTERDMYQLSCNLESSSYTNDSKVLTNNKFMQQLLEVYEL